MATTEHFYTGNGSTTTYSFTFPYLKNADIKVSLDDVLKTETTHYTVSSTNIVFGSAPGSNVAIRIYRDTDVDTSKATFAAGSSIRAQDLNDNTTQLLYHAQEQKQLIRTSGIAAGQVTSAKVLANTIVDADVNSSAAIAGTKISPNFGTQNIVTSGTAATGALTVTGNIGLSGTIDGRDLVNDGNKLDTIESSATQDQTPSEIRLAVQTATDSNVFTDAYKTKLDGIESGATIDQSNTDIRSAVEAATDSNVFTDADHSKLNAIEAGATGDQTNTEIKTAYEANSNTNAYIDTHNALVGGITATASELNKLDGVTSTATNLNIVSGMGKQTTISDSDTNYPTSGAVVDYVASQITNLGGITSIANEDSFPTSQPANGQMVSISDAQGVVVNGSGVSTTARTSGNGSDNVTINGFPSTLYSETLAAGNGLIVTSTGSNHTYTYHKLLASEADVKQLSDDINDFNSRYRIGSSNPSSNNDDGDLFFNTSSNKMLVYNATGSSWDEVQSVGNFFINTISSYSGTGGNSATFNGSAYRFVLSNAPTYAQQLIVSVNGVLQKPNAGTSQPSEGFAIDGSSIIFSSAPPSGADYFIITIGASVNIGSPSDNTVGNAAIIDGAIDNAAVNTNAAIAGSKLADDSITEAKLDIHNAPSGTDKYLKYTSNGMEWATAGSGTPEGTAILSTGESGTAKFLRIDGDGSCSWQVPSYTTNTDTQLTTEQVQDIVGAMFSGNTETNITATYEDSDGTIDLVSTDTNTQLTEEQVEDFVGGMVTGNTETGITVTYEDSDGTLDFVVDDTTKMPLAGGTFTGDVIFDNATNAGKDLTWDMSDNALEFTDDTKAVFGTGNDLEIYHDGTDSFIKNSTGTLKLYTTHFNVKSADGSEEIMSGDHNGACKLNYDNATKVQTSATGVTVTGTVAATAYTGDGSALTGVAAASADGCMYKNTLTISNAHTIAATEGAHSVGPITLNNTVTVNGRWVIS